MRASGDLVKQLRRLGVADNEQLLKAGSTNLDRHGLSEALGVEIEQVVRLVNRVDLLRVSGLDDQSISLLNLAGITSLQDLARCNPERLCARLGDLKGARTGKDIDVRTIERWVAQASSLPRRVWD
jgi:hypothetical protein